MTSKKFTDSLMSASDAAATRLGECLAGPPDAQTRDRLSRRAVMALGLAPLLAPAIAFAQATPDAKPIRLLVPFTAGGGTDSTARVIAQQLQHLMERPVIVDNRPGAGGAIAANAVAKSEPDGSTLLFASNSFLTNSEIAKVPYDIRKDFTPIGIAGTSPYLLVVNANSQIKTVAELVAEAKRNPERMSFGSAGNGSVTHLIGELFKQRTGVNAVQVPYKGTSAAIIDLIAGQLQFMFADVTSALPQVKGGKLRALAITSPARSALLPDVPTALESNVDMEMVGFYGVFGPARMPQPVVVKINEALRKALSNSDVKTQFAALAIATESTSLTPTQFASRVAAEGDLWRNVIKKSGLSFD